MSGVQVREHVREGLTSRVLDWIERHSTILLLVFLAVFAWEQAATGTTKPLWYDEMYTFNLATQPSWHLFQVSLPADANPPLYGLLARFCIQLLGASEFVLRLPALLAYMGAIVFTYLFVRRRGDALLGLIAATLLATNRFAELYAREARPYGFVLLFTAMALYAFQRATDGARPARWALGLLTLAIAGGVLSHHFAVLSIGFPLLCGEAVRTWRRRRVDVPLLLASVAGLLPLIYTVRLARATFSLTRHHLMVNYPMSLHQLLVGYKYMIAPMITVFLILALFLFFARPLTGERPWALIRERWPLHECVAAFAATLILGFVFSFIRLTTGYYAGPRYGLATAIGLAMVCAIVASAYSPAVRLGFLVAALSAMVQIPRFQPKPSDLTRDCMEDLPAKTVVIARGLLFPSAWHYASPQLRSRLFYATGAEFDHRGAYFLEDMAMTPKEIAPPHMVDYKDFLKMSPDFYYVMDLQEKPDEVDFYDYLVKAGYRFQDIVPSNNGCLLHIREVTRP